MPLKSQLPVESLEDLSQCPYCGSKRSALLFRENEFPYLDCQDCGLIYLQTRLKIESLNLIYDDVSYHNISAGDYHTRNGLKRFQLLPKSSPGARIHEDGAGNGAFVFQCLKQGHQGTGSDFGKDAVNKAREAYEVELKQGSLQQQNILPGSLDVLACFNLICHLYEPWSYFQHVSSLLKPKGYFLIRIGNRAGFFKKFQQGQWGAPEHVYHFNSTLLTKMLGDCGLQVVWIRPAFDSDFPYLFFDYARTHKGILGKLAQKICGITIRLWTLFRLPKEDIYLLAQKS